MTQFTPPSHPITGGIVSKVIASNVGSLTTAINLLIICFVGLRTDGRRLFTCQHTSAPTRIVAVLGHCLSVCLGCIQTMNFYRPLAPISTFTPSTRSYRLESGQVRHQASTNKVHKYHTTTTNSLFIIPPIRLIGMTTRRQSHTTVLSIKVQVCVPCQCPVGVPVQIHRGLFWRYSHC